MKDKKIVALFLVLALVFAGVGCASPQPTPQPVAPPVNQNEYEYENGFEFEESSPEVHQVVFEGERYNEQEFSDENVQLAIFFDRPQYTHSDIINMFTTITNIGEQVVVFTKGSGSNRVPDAIEVELGQLAELFRPIMMTMDMQTSVLEPGESVTFALPFAPYVYADTDAEFPPMIGFDRDIEFFQSDEWVRAQTGEIAGSINFSYVTRGADDIFMIVEGDETIGMQLSFTVTLTENSEEEASPVIQYTPELETSEEEQE